jgi:hypothetical protein
MLHSRASPNKANVSILISKRNNKCVGEEFVSIILSVKRSKFRFDIETKHSVRLRFRFDIESKENFKLTIRFDP